MGRTGNTVKPERRRGHQSPKHGSQMSKADREAKRQRKEAADVRRDVAANARAKQSREEKAGPLGRGPWDQSPAQGGGGGSPPGPAAARGEGRHDPPAQRGARGAGGPRETGQAAPERAHRAALGGRAGGLAAATTGRTLL